MKFAGRSALLLAVLTVPLSKAAFAVEETITRVYITDKYLAKFFNYSPFGNLPPYAKFLELEEVLARRHPVKAAPASQANSSKDCSKTPISANPVIIATGEKIKTESDFTSLGRYGLSLERTYRSKHNTGTLFGPNWLSNLDPARITPSGTCTRRLSNWPCVPDSFILTEPDGTKYTYTYKSHLLGARTDDKTNASTGMGENDDGMVAATGSDGHASAGNLPLDEIGETGDGSEVPQSFLYTVKDAAATGTLTYSLDQETMLNRGKKRYFFQGGRLSYYFDGDTGQRLTYLYSVEAAPKLQRVTNLVGQYVQFTWSGNRVGEVRDPAGSIWRYGYDGNGMLASVTAPGTSPDQRSYHYEPTRPELLTGISINGVRHSTYTYHTDTSRRVWTSALAGEEEKETFTYGDKVTQVVDARGQATSYTYVDIGGELRISAISRAVTSTCPAATARTYYDANGYVDYTVDWKGNKTDLTYDAAGKLTAVTTAAGTADALTIQYRWNGDEVYEATQLSTSGVPYLRTNFHFHPAGSPSAGWLANITRTDLQTGESRSTNFGYAFHPNGAVAEDVSSVTLPNGEAALTVAYYDALANRTALVNPVGHTQRWSESNGLGQPALLVDENQAQTRYTYNLNGTLATITEPGRGTTRLGYNRDRQLASVSTADGQVSRFTYNAGGRLEYIGNALNEHVRMAMTSPTAVVETSARRVPSWSAGVLSSVANGQFVSSSQLDSLGRDYTATGNNNQRVDYRYDNNGNLLTRTDRLGYVTRYEYDAQDRLRRIIAPDDGVTEFIYDYGGRLKDVLDPRKMRTTFTYNAFGDMLTSSSPDTGLIQSWYDIGGRKTQERFNDGKVFTYRYDALGRMRVRGSGTMGEEYIYDQGVNGIGRLTAITDWTGRTDFTYDSAGRLIRQDNDIYGGRHQTSWRYDALGRLEAMTYPTGLSLAFGYDAYGRLATLRSNLAGTWATLGSSFLYQPATDQLYGWRFGNGLPRMMTYDADGRLQQISTPSAHRLDLNYHFNDTISVINNAVFPVLNTSYLYDRANRLTEARVSGDSQTFRWDVAGNRIASSRERQGGYTYNMDAGSNRLASWSGAGLSRSFGYNNNGDLATDRAQDGTIRHFGYDQFNRMNEVYRNNIRVGDYRYNAFNQRSYKIARGEGTAAIYGPDGELLAEIGRSRTSCQQRL